MIEQGLRRWVASTLAERLSPERTRQATRFERMTVRRLSWARIVQLNRVFELVGKIATGVWIALLAALAAGVDLESVVKDALTSGETVEGALVGTILLITLLFVAARSLLGFARWRLQRELWRRDVERLTARPHDGAG